MAKAKLIPMKEEMAKLLKDTMTAVAMIKDKPPSADTLKVLREIRQNANGNVVARRHVPFAQSKVVEVAESICAEVRKFGFFKRLWNRKTLREIRAGQAELEALAQWLSSHKVK